MSSNYESAFVNEAVILHSEQLLDSSKSIEVLNKDLKKSKNPYFVLEITRSNIIEDTFKQILLKHSDIKKPLKVVFMGEMGLDQGGVQKEYFHVLFGNCLIPWYFVNNLISMFVYDSDTRLCWINPLSTEYENYLLVGVLIALAVYNGKLA